MTQCTRESCDRRHYAKGLCQSHYQDAKRARVAQCVHIDCTEGQYARTVCVRHYRQLMDCTAAWRRANPAARKEQDRRAKHLRRARERAAQTEPVDFGNVLREHGMVCHLCTEAIERPSELEFDHVVPLSRGGAHSEANLRPAHGRCNRIKGSRLTVDRPSSNRS